MEKDEVKVPSIRQQVDIEEESGSIPTFDPEAERKLRSKIDWRLMPTLVVLYTFCFIDRANIGNARIAGLEEDLGMHGYDYNTLLSIFFISYILFEIPSNIICKLVGPGWFIPALTLLFGVCSLVTAWVQTFPQLIGVRFLLGLFEAGMNPGTAYYLSRWYRRSELTFRLSLYIVSAPLAGAFGGLLASGILSLDSIGSLKSWRMIYAVEGIITIGLGIIGLYTLTDRPETASWLSPEEKELAEARLRSERMGQSELLDRMDKTKLMRGIINPVTLSNSTVFLLCNITVQGLAVFAPTIVKTIYSHETTVHQQLYTVPPYAVGSVLTLLICLWSWKIDRRQYFIIMAVPLVIVGYIMFLASKNASVRYGAIFLVTSSIFSLGALTASQVSANVVSDTARSSAIGTNAMIGSIGGLISTWSFLPGDAPDYPIGNGLNLATNVMILTVATVTLIWMKKDNVSRDKKETEALSTITDSPDEREALDWKHPSFRWRI